jgi:hypothetical protein
VAASWPGGGVPPLSLPSASPPEAPLFNPTDSAMEVEVVVEGDGDAKAVEVPQVVFGHATWNGCDHTYG